MDSKSSETYTQLQGIFLFLKKQTATARMISEYTGIPHTSICKWKKVLEKRGLLIEVEKKPCKVSGQKSYYLSCNPAIFPMMDNDTTML